MAASESTQKTGNEARKREVNWAVLVNIGTITADQRKLIEIYGQNNAEGQRKLFDQNGPAYASLFIDVLGNCSASNDELPQYILELVREKLEDEQTARTMIELLNSVPDATSRLINLLRRQDPYTLSLTCDLLATMYAGGAGDNSEEFINHLCRYLMSTDPKLIEMAIGAFQKLLRSPEYRLLFVRRTNAFEKLVSLLDLETSSFQLVYQVVFCLWLVSYDTEVVAVINTPENSVISAVYRVVKNVPLEQEKITRVSLAFLLNLSAHPDNGQLMVTIGMLKVLANLSTRDWHDKDILEAIHKLEDALQVYEQDLSSIGQFREEVLSETLTWSPVHKSERFWRGYHQALLEDNCKLVKALVEICRRGRGELNLQVALFDLGEFVRYSPDGKRVVEDPKIGGKTAVLNLLHHPHPDVAKEALVALQKMMIKNWDLVKSGKGGEDEAS